MPVDSRRPRDSWRSGHGSDRAGASGRRERARVPRRARPRAGRAPTRAAAATGSRGTSRRTGAKVRARCRGWANARTAPSCRRGGAWRAPDGPDRHGARRGGRRGWLARPTTGDSRTPSSRRGRHRSTNAHIADSGGGAVTPGQRRARSGRRDSGRRGASGAPCARQPSAAWPPKAQGRPRGSRRADGERPPRRAGEPPVQRRPGR